MGKATLTELQTWSIDDVEDANDVIDSWDRAGYEAQKAEHEKMNRGRK